MKKGLFCIFFLLFSKFVYSELYITFPTASFGKYGKYLCRNRLGNNLCTFLHAYQLAKQYNATLVCEPLDINIYSKLKGKVKLIPYNQFVKIKKFKPIRLHQMGKIDTSKHNYLFQCKNYSLYSNFLSPKEKKEFRDIFFQDEENTRIKKIPNKLYIGLHIRTGENFDLPLKSKRFFSRKDLIGPKTKKVAGEFLDVLKPLKAPPIQYFIDAMLYFVKNISKDVVFVVFSDAVNTAKLCELLNYKTIASVVTIESIKTINSDFSEILGLLEMDGLIIPGQSTFSVVPLMIGSYSYVIKPCGSLWQNGCLLMKNIKLTTPTSTDSFELYP